jgi:hypothetical protein
MTIRLRVGDLTFHVDPTILRRSPVLVRCLEESGDLRIRPNEEGMYEIERDGLLFRDVILPVLQKGYFSARVDSLSALGELSYFGLSEACPNGISIDEATALCRLVIDRILFAMNHLNTKSFYFFSENVNFSPLDIEFDVTLVTSVFGHLLRSRALTDYSLALDWFVSDIEVSFCTANKAYRVEGADDHVHTYVSFLRPASDELDQWKAQAAFPLKPIATEDITSTYNRFLVEGRRGVMEDKQIRVHVTTYYDLTSKRTMVDVEVFKIGTWVALQSYALSIVSATCSDWEEFKAQCTTLERTRDVLESSPVVNVLGQRACIRIQKHITTVCIKHQRFPYAGAPLWVTLFSLDGTRESLVVNDPRPRTGVSRVVTQTRKRRLCKMQAVLLAL